MWWSYGFVILSLLVKAAVGEELNEDFPTWFTLWFNQYYPGVIPHGKVRRSVVLNYRTRMFMTDEEIAAHPNMLEDNNVRKHFTEGNPVGWYFAFGQAAVLEVVPVRLVDHTFELGACPVPENRIAFVSRVATDVSRGFFPEAENSPLANILIRRKSDQTRVRNIRTCGYVGPGRIILYYWLTVNGFGLEIASFFHEDIMVDSVIALPKVLGSVDGATPATSSRNMTLKNIYPDYYPATPDQFLMYEYDSEKDKLSIVKPLESGTEIVLGFYELDERDELLVRSKLSSVANAIKERKIVFVGIIDRYGHLKSIPGKPGVLREVRSNRPFIPPGMIYSSGSTPRFYHPSNCSSSRDLRPRPFADSRMPASRIPIPSPKSLRDVRPDDFRNPKPQNPVPNLSSGPPRKVWHIKLRHRPGYAKPRDHVLNFSGAPPPRNSPPLDTRLSKQPSNQATRGRQKSRGLNGSGSRSRSRSRSNSPPRRRH